MGTFSSCQESKKRTKIVETIFRETSENGEFLYWYSIQGKGGTAVHDSHHEIDRIHLAFWQECIDKSFGREDLITEVVMVPLALQAKMK